MAKKKVEDKNWPHIDTTEPVVEKKEKKAKKTKKTEWVMVETVSTFRMRYMVEVPKGKSDKAIELVQDHDAKEFSQQHIGELVTSSWVLDHGQAIAMCDADNDYCRSWDDDKKIEAFFTRIGEKVDF